MAPIRWRCNVTDPVPLLRALIRCRSVTPAEAGALQFAARALQEAGFATKELRFSALGTPDVDNLFARFGTGRKHFCFAGHVDVVPPGNEQSWTYPPFEGAVAQGFVYGRGASDMKGSVAAFMAAAIDFAAERGSAFTGAFSRHSGESPNPA